jgi:hypothetical protein
MVVFLTGAGGQGKTTTADALATRHGWGVVANGEHDIVDRVDPHRERDRSPAKYLEYRVTVWRAFCHSLRLIGPGTPSPIVFDSCPFGHHAALLRRLCSTWTEIGPDFVAFEGRAIEVMDQMQSVERDLVAAGAMFFLFPFGRVGQLEDDLYRSTSRLSHMALEKVVRSLLVECQATYIEVPRVDAVRTADWIAARCRDPDAH